MNRPSQIDLGETGFVRGVFPFICVSFCLIFAKSSFLYACMHLLLLVEAKEV